MEKLYNITRPSGALSGMGLGLSGAAAAPSSSEIL